MLEVLLNKYAFIAGIMRKYSNHSFSIVFGDEQSKFIPQDFYRFDCLDLLLNVFLSQCQIDLKSECSDPKELFQYQNR